MTGRPVTILMATLNGARYLPAQLESLCAQDFADWSLIVSDDGSTDDTLSQLEAFRAGQPGRSVRIVAGPHRGSAANFLSLVLHLPEAAGPVLFCDQDDIWLPTRISAALRHLAAVEGPAVYACRTRQIGPVGREGLLSEPRRFGNGFGTALVQNVLAGNTLALNAEAFGMLRQSVPAALAGEGVPFHDWWIYQIATGAGMAVLQDDAAHVLYRQHGGNALGAHRGWRATLSRGRAIQKRVYAGWIGRNLAALGRAADLLTVENRELLDDFVRVRAMPRLSRPAALRRLGLRRGERGGALVLALLAVLDRL